MWNSAEGTAEEPRGSNQNHNDQSEEWETMARAWLCSFPEPKELSMTEVEAWIDSNHGSLPEGLKSMPRSDLCHRLISIQNCMRLPDQEREVNQLDLPHARFQRTDQWIPVYSWLETLDKDEVVKSKEISDWLTENPKVQEQLCSRHSRYHLMHYIKKCHLKILKRREKRKGLEQPDKDTSLKVQKDVAMKHTAPLPLSTQQKLAHFFDTYMVVPHTIYQKIAISPWPKEMKRIANMRFYWSWRSFFPHYSQSVLTQSNEAISETSTVVSAVIEICPQRKNADSLAPAYY